MSSENNNWQRELQALLDSAETDEDLLIVQQLLEEREKLPGKGETLHPRIVNTLGEVAKAVGVELGTVRDWRTGADPMPGEEGKYDLVEILLWRCERLKKNAVNAKSPELIEVELQSKKEDLRKRQIANQMKAGLLRDSEAIVAKVMEMNNDARMLLESVPADIGPLLPQDIRNEVMQRVGQAINLILKKMAQKASQASE